MRKLNYKRPKKSPLIEEYITKYTVGTEYKSFSDKNNKE